MATSNAVQVRCERVTIPTYMPAPPDRNPMFLEKRVYQGSSGRVYPLPFTDRIAPQPVPRQWQAVWLENEYLRVMVLPEIGGRIHALQDKTNGYDLIYRQEVIKPALVGLAGPWISGGIEFNWPQHHRPGTFLPVDTDIEHSEDGSITLWCSDHDPMQRMKGMHGVCLRPGIARLELRVRAYNRTPHVQTFLWWANVATRVHEAYQSFFPPDVYYVADHARRSTSRYPLCDGFYYGVDYAGRARNGVPAAQCPSQFRPPSCGGNPPVTYPANDLSFYANIPVPTSYMCMGSRQDFFGGYDHAAQAGIVHVANHHMSPGKKQWTWGNHAFGYAWDRNLTDPGAAGGSPAGERSPYIEIMAGVYTDNQPDFSFLQPGETKTWTQVWYPIQKIGPAHHANADVAVHLQLDRREMRVGVGVSRAFPGASVELSQDAQQVHWTVDLAPGQPFLLIQDQPKSPFVVGKAVLRVHDSQHKLLMEYRPQKAAELAVPPAATEPAQPGEIASSDELFITGVHLEQYRHAIRDSAEYWREALRRDPHDSRCNTAMGRWHLRRGELDLAEKHLRTAIARQTKLNANPSDGEALYQLGLVLRYAMDADPALPDTADPRFEQSYAIFYKCTWNGGWAGAGYHALAELDCRRGDWESAAEHLQHALRFNADNLRAANLQVMVLQQLGQREQAKEMLRRLRKLDPLDWWARHLAGEAVRCDLQTVLDLVHDLARAGFYAEAMQLLQPQLDRPAPQSDPLALPDAGWGAAPMAWYTLAWLQARLGNATAAADAARTAAEVDPQYCFPARLEELRILRWAMQRWPQDARAPYYLGNLLYDRRRHAEAIALWERSVRREPAFSIPWRNLGIGYFNVQGNAAKARRAYERALAAAPTDARLVMERDQLWKRAGVPPARRLKQLMQHADLVAQRDDLTIELCALLNQVGRPAEARALLSERTFQPWEGGEGQALGQWVRTHLLLGRRRLGAGDPTAAAEYFTAALTPPVNLSEASHLLANQSDIHYWLGEAYSAAGQRAQAKAHWTAAAEFKGDFQQMSVRAYSEMTYFSALSLQRLGRRRQSETLLRDLLKFGKSLFSTPAKIDYFATSLPAMLLFEDDLQRRQETTALLLQGLARLGLGERAAAAGLLAQVLQRDPNQPLAADFLADLRTGAAEGVSGRRSTTPARRSARQRWEHA